LSVRDATTFFNEAPLLSFKRTEYSLQKIAAKDFISGLPSVNSFAKELETSEI